MFRESVITHNQQTERKPRVIQKLTHVTHREIAVLFDFEAMAVTVALELKCCKGSPQLLAAKTGFPIATVRRQLERMVSLGIIVVEGGRYSLNNKDFEEKIHFNVDAETWPIIRRAIVESFSFAASAAKKAEFGEISGTSAMFPYRLADQQKIAKRINRFNRQLNKDFASADGDTVGHFIGCVMPLCKVER